MSRKEIGGGDRTRTRNTLDQNQVPYQFGYTPTIWRKVEESNPYRLFTDTPDFKSGCHPISGTFRQLHLNFFCLFPSKSSVLLFMLSAGIEYIVPSSVNTNNKSQDLLSNPFIVLLVLLGLTDLI